MTKNKTITSTQDLGHSPDALIQRKDELLALIRQTAPEVMADNQINVEKLKELLGQDFIASDEHYELNWAGKFAARREIQKTSSLTLRPDASNPVNAQHMLIEGENLEVLRVLQKSYYGKIKLIYIDPPYNTGNDSFVYPDDYSETLEAYQKRSGLKNEAGYLNKQSLWKKNSKESGQYHSAWLSMMYPRLYLARNLLRDDGVIFISIDSNEAANLKILCDEIFGAENFLSNIVWEKRFTRSNNSKTFATLTETILCYRKSPALDEIKEPRNEKADSTYANPDNDPRGVWTSVSYVNPATREQRPNLTYPLINPITGEKVIHPTNAWKYEKATYELHLQENKLYWGVSGGNKFPRLKKFLTEMDGGMVPVDLWDRKSAGTTDEASKALEVLLGGKYFDFPKPVALVKKAINLAATNEGDIVLDFFAGSGTTANSVMEINVEQGISRQFICVQMPELLDESSEAYKAGYRTIADITRARINNVITKIKTEYPDSTKDLACAQFVLSQSNFKVWRSDVDDSEALREQLAMFQSAEKDDLATQADAQTAMLTELLLKHGLGALGVNAIAKPRQLAGVTVHRVLMADDKTMWLCFETYTDSLKEEIVKAMPAQVVMLNSCFVGKKADEQLANLQLELAGLDIGLTVI